MTVDELIAALQKLSAEGYGSTPVEVCNSGRVEHVDHPTAHDPPLVWIWGDGSTAEG